MKLICKYCRKEFISNYSKKIFCSKDCYTNYQKGKPSYPNIINKRGKKPKNQIRKICKICGEEYSVWVGRKDTSNYCSRNCWSKRNPKILNQCLFCGKDFWDWKGNNRIYCNKKCYSLHLRILKKEKNSPLWKGGKTKINQLLRTRTEYLDWRNKIFQRDNYTCQECGIKSGNGVKIYLNVHHKKSFSEYPDLRFNLDNGVTLCKNCHLLEHSKIAEARIKPFLEQQKLR